MKQVDQLREQYNAAIDFAIDELDDNVKRVEFLKNWREGDTSNWPEFALYEIKRRLSTGASA